MYFVVWFICSVGTTWSMLNAYTNPSVASTAVFLLEASIPLSTFIGFFAGILSAMAVFSYMYSPKSAGMFSSLPMKRSGMFLTSYLSGLFWLIVIPVILAVILAIIELCFGVFSLLYVFKWLAIVCLTTFFFYSFASLCAMLTGNIFVLPIVYAIFNFLVMGLDAVITTITDTFIYGVSSSIAWASGPLSPVYALFTQRMFFSHSYMDTPGYTINWSDGIVTASNGATAQADIVYTGWGLLLIYFIVAVLCIFLAVFLYKRRRMESASDVVAIPILKPVFRYCMSIGCAMVGGIILYSLLFTETNSIIRFIFYMLIGGFIGYFASEMLIQKSFKVFKKWKGFVVVCLIIVIMSCALEFDLFGVESYVPDASEIEYINMHCRYDYKLEDTSDIQQILDVHKGVVENRNYHENRDHLFDDNYSTLSLRLQYSLKSGKTITRFYSLHISEAALQDQNSEVYKLQEFTNMPSMIASRYLFDYDTITQNIAYSSIGWYDNDYEYHSFNLTNDQTSDLYSNCIVPDIEAGRLGRENLFEIDYTNPYDYEVYIEVLNRLPASNTSASSSINTEPEYIYSYYTYTITPEAALSHQWILDNLESIKVTSQNESSYKID